MRWRPILIGDLLSGLEIVAWVLQPSTTKLRDSVTIYGKFLGIDNSIEGYNKVRDDVEEISMVPAYSGE